MLEGGSKVDQILLLLDSFFQMHNVAFVSSKTLLGNQ